MVRGRSSIREEGRAGDAGRGPVGQWDRDSQTEERSRRAEGWQGGTAGWALKGHCRQAAGLLTQRAEQVRQASGVRRQMEGKQGPLLWSLGSRVHCCKTFTARRAHKPARERKEKARFRTLPACTANPRHHPPSCLGWRWAPLGAGSSPTFPSPDSIPGSL